MPHKKQVEIYKKKILILSNTASMIVQFNMCNLHILKDLGYQAEVACNFLEGNTCTIEMVNQLKRALDELEIPFHQIDFKRGRSSISKHYIALNQVKKLIKKEKYDVIFCQSTIAGVAGRWYGKKYHCKVIYIAHGFQFYEGASKIRWAVFYHIEKILSKKTDTLILTNEDDFRLAKKNFGTSDMRFVPGVGLDISSYELEESFNRSTERKKWGLASDDYVIFSAGELSERKNHRIIMELIRDLANPSVKYLICGIGPLEDEYKQLIKKWNMEDRIILLGYQKNLKSIYGISDLFVLPSLNEGLPVCLLMSIASKVVSVCSDIRGNHELVRDKRYLFPPMDKAAIRKCMEYAMKHQEENRRIVENNYINLKRYGRNHVDKLMKQVFEKYL